MTSLSTQLSPEHARMLQASGLTVDVISARGYRTIITGAELQRLGFGAAQRNVPTLLVPIWGAGGEIALYHHRPDRPRQRDGKMVKYEFPAGSRMALDVPPGARETVRRPDVPLFITEGVKKADAAVSAGLCCLGVIGVWNWRGTNEWGGKTALPDWDEIAFKDKGNAPRQVYIVYDSDVMLKTSVHQALARLSAFLKSRGAKVAFVYLPHGADGRKVGLDDYLAAGHTTEDLLALASPSLREPKGQDGQETEDAPRIPYRETPHGLTWCKTTRDGVVETPLCNFTARIVADVVEDDGAETRRTFTLEACRGGRRERVSVPASAFPLMNWPTETLGAGALLYPGLGAKDHTRAAIQLLSGDPPLQRVYTHTGWRQNEEGSEGSHWFYLHAGGAIGASVPVSVQLPAVLDRFRLPDPLEGSALAQAGRAVLDLWNLLPDALSVPLFCTVWRAVLGSGDFSLHLAGPSGAFKSELAALVQQHFGTGLDARHLPGAWTATDNALEGLAFAVKDAVMVVDDFAPTGTGLDVQRLHAKADRLLRGQGNNSGRLRMRADASLKAPKYPRGLILSTGEDIPQGHSLRARLLSLEVPPGAVCPAALTRCQQQAGSGVYARVLTAFLTWLAPRYGQVQGELTGQKNRLRDQSCDQSPDAQTHRRTPEIVANLGVGLFWFLRFLAEAGAITDKDEESLWKRGWNALNEAGHAQGGHQAASEPTRRYLELIRAALASGKAHLAAPSGDAPTQLPAAWGWRSTTVGVGENERLEQRHQGDRIGWIDGDDIYLQPDATYQVARRLGEGTGDGLALNPKTLNKRLHERGLLVTTERERNTLTVRRTLSGSRHNVLHLSASHFIPSSTYVPTEKPAQPAQTTSSEPTNERFVGQTGQIGQVFETKNGPQEEWRP